MNRYETLIKIKCREKVFTLDAILKSVFWNEKMQKSTREGRGGKWEINELAKPTWILAKQLLEKMKKEKVMTKSCYDIQKEFGIGATR